MLGIYYWLVFDYGVSAFPRQHFPYVNALHGSAAYRRCWLTDLYESRPLRVICNALITMRTVSFDGQTNVVGSTFSWCDYFPVNCHSNNNNNNTNNNNNSAESACNYIAIRGVVSVGDFVTCSFKCNYHEWEACKDPHVGCDVMLPVVRVDTRFWVDLWCIYTPDISHNISLSYPSYHCAVHGCI